MSNPVQLAEEVARLSRREHTVFRDRLRELRIRNIPALPEPKPGASRDEVAAWAATDHLRFDPDITDVWYLPTGAPAKEIRLLATNLFRQEYMDEVVPLDFGLDVSGLDFTLLVAEVTPEQAKRILADGLALPAGWNLAGAEHFGANGE